MKSIIFLMLVAGTAAHAELAKDCDSSCRLNIFLIESQHFPLTSFNASDRQAAIRYVGDKAARSNSLWVKMRALEVLNGNASSTNAEIRAVALNAIKTIGAGCGDTTIEYKSIEMIGHSLKSENAEIVVLAADLISQIGVQSGETFTKAVAENTLGSNDVGGRLETIKSMIAIQPK